ncbi:HEAT repeat domain-containing protein [Streptomyces sp. NPDC001820]|uniref:HEAT repeat domain-containing protein n=1 Tax=Streptomyces sp. NPDC001820 TaxID=3364613 RepID=UPI00368AF6A2
MDVFEPLAWSFTVALREDPALYTEAERIFAEHLSDPAGLVRSWAAFTERLGAVSAYTFDDELCWDIRAQQGTMRELGWTEEGAPGSAPTFAHHLKLQRAVMDVHAALRRSAPLPPGTAERVREEVRLVLDQALAHPPGSEERAELLIIELPGSPDSRAWRDRACAGARLDEILALCGSGDLTRVSVGVEALDYLTTFQIHGRTGPILAALGSLAVPGQDVFVLAKVLGCYGSLAIDHQLDEMPVALFLSCARHTHPDVRSSAAAGLPIIARNSLEEASAVAVLVELLDHDPDHDVRSSAGMSLARFTCGDEANTRRASAALARYGDSPDAALRSSSVSRALERKEPQAVRRLLDELESPDPAWQFVLLAESCATDLALEDDTPSALLIEFEKAIMRLQQSGWAERGDPDGYPDPEERAGMLARARENLREFAS